MPNTPQFTRGKGAHTLICKGLLTSYSLSKLPLIVADNIVAPSHPNFRFYIQSFLRYAGCGVRLGSVRVTYSASWLLFYQTKFEVKEKSKYYGPTMELVIDTYMLSSNSIYMLSSNLSEYEFPEVIYNYALMWWCTIWFLLHSRIYW